MVQGPRTGQTAQAVEPSGAGTHGPDRQLPARVRRQAAQDAAGFQREASDDEKSTLARGLDPGVTAAVRPPPARPSPPASG
jgi:hypothetical protein